MTPQIATGSPAASVPPIKVVALYKRNVPLDEQVLRLLETHLQQNGYAVFIDRQPNLGVEWAKDIERQIRTADAVVPLLSAESVASEMLGFEIEIGHEAAQTQRGRPRLLPIRINYAGPLPEPLAGILDPLPCMAWDGSQDDQRLLTELSNALKNLVPSKPAVRMVPGKGLRLTPRPLSPPRPAPVLAPPATPIWQVPLEPVGGAVPLHSEFYLARPADTDLRNALIRGDSIILVKGARQIGKTSLMARGLQFSRERGAKVALTDFQKFNAVNLETVGNLYLTLAESLADQLELPVMPAEVWDERRGPNVNFERFLRREVLGKLNSPLVWGLDEVDRLFVTSYGSEVFGLFRSWHNERALDPTGPWAGLSLVIAYATEAHLFITDMNQSPFNVGTRLTLEDFTLDQVAELNRRCGSPLKEEQEVKRFTGLVDGHPFLVRRGLHEMATSKIDIAEFEARADLDEGIFGDHLRRILVLLAKDAALTDVVRGVLRGQPCSTPESFYRLRSAGVMAGNSQSDVRPRCQLYAKYLSRHLL